MEANILKIPGTLKFPDMYNIQLDHYYTTPIIGIERAERVLELFKSKEDIKELRHLLRFSDIEIKMKG